MTRQRQVQLGTNADTLQYAAYTVHIDFIEDDNGMQVYHIDAPSALSAVVTALQYRNQSTYAEAETDFVEYAHAHTVYAGHIRPVFDGGLEMAVQPACTRYPVLRLRQLGLGHVRGSPGRSAEGVAFGRRYTAFTDLHGQRCELLEATNMIGTLWMGIPEPMIRQVVLGSLTEVPLPEGMMIFPRMLLDQTMVKNMLPRLQYFADTGHLPPMLPSEEPANV